MIFQLLYTSKSVHPRGHESDVDILRAALGRNAMRGITGYLLRDENGFCGVLEGSEPNVATAFSAIRRDRRHSAITQHMSRWVSQRSFADWTMSYATLDERDGRFIRNRLDAGRWGVVVPFPLREAAA